MEFEHYTVVLLMTNPDAPQLDEERAAALQDAHLDHLASLHEAGHVLAAGPVSDPKREFRGLSLLGVDVETARALKEADPAVQAGVFVAHVLPWMTPAGALHFAQTTYPHSIADVVGTQSAQS